MATSSTSAKTRSSAKGVVVWEWFNEFGKWRPYSPDVVSYIDKEAQHASQVHLGTISPCLQMYTIDIPSMCQIRKGTGTSRPVRRVIYPELSPPARQVRWEFEGDQAGQWLPYDMEISQCLEQAQCSGQQMLDMNALFKMPYSVHFTTMQQVRMNTGKTRQIRRSPLQTPYPLASKSARGLNQITTVMTDISFMAPPGPSSSALALPSGRGMLLRGVKRASRSSSSDSSSDSDSDALNGMTLRARPRLPKKLKKSHGGGAGGGSSANPSGGKKSGKSSFAAAVAVAAPPPTSATTLTSSGAGLSSSSLNSLSLTQQPASSTSGFAAHLLDKETFLTRAPDNAGSCVLDALKLRNYAKISTLCVNVTRRF